jgi:ADP-heptose:LPS heptosyltransferase
VSRPHDPPEGAAPEGAPRVLVLRFHSLGDVVLSTAIVRALAEGQPGSVLPRGPARVEVVTDRIWAPVFDGLEQAARIHLREEPGTLPPGARFDLVVDLQGTPGSQRLARRYGPARRLRTRAAARRWVVLWGNRFPRPRIPTALERYAEAAGFSADAAGALRPLARATEADRAEALRLAPQAMEGETGRAVALLTGASRRSKEDPAESFLAVARGLARREIPVWWIAPPEGIVAVQQGSGAGGGENGAEEQRRRAEEAWSREGHLWRLPLGALKAVLARAALAVGNDSGPLHLAGALGVRSVGLFGSSVRAFGFAPSGPGDVVLEAEDLACRPCGVHGRNRCWLGHWRCLRDLTAGAVLERTLAVLGKDV